MESKKKKTAHTYNFDNCSSILIIINEKYNLKRAHVSFIVLDKTKDDPEVVVVRRTNPKLNAIVISSTIYIYGTNTFILL